ncbi:hypothetical protein ACFCWB_33265 [Streptomyces bacillaris]|uniref:hypothetical protein n=1 Tax=Streptomyces bacillaris TaxID=68179 RepID=UPI0035DADB28
MDQCTGIMLTTAPAHIITLLSVVREFRAGHVLCELGEEHDGDHATMLWDEDAGPGGAAWARWNGRGVQIASLDWCPEAATGKENACGLFADHPAAHGWEVTDPTREAISRELAKGHPDLYPEYNEDDEN